MSYLRAGYPHKYVVGTSKDYVYQDEGYIEDYDKLSDKSIVELLFNRWETEDVLFKEYLLKKLAKRLGIRLRKNPLSNNEILDIHEKRIKKYPFIKKIIKQQLLKKGEK